jgi:hypothetical protein
MRGSAQTTVATADAKKMSKGDPGAMIDNRAFQARTDHD